MELSKAEIEILDLLCEGLSNTEISERRFTSRSTTKAHLIKIYKKMGFAKNTDNVRLKTILKYREIKNAGLY